MKAFVARNRGGFDQVEQIETEKPAPAKGEVLLKVKASSLNPADLKVVSGKDGGRFVHAWATPIRLGFDFSGELVELGKGVNSWSLGDQVFGHLPYSTLNSKGSLADYVSVKANEIARKPAEVEHIQAAATNTAALTAWQAMFSVAKLQKGQKVLINGASGGVGCFAVQLGRHIGAEIWGTCSSKNSEFVKSMGADHVIDYREQSIADLGQSFDMVFDVASNMGYSKAAPFMTKSGSYVTLGPSASLIQGILTSTFSKRSCTMVLVKSLPAHLEAMIKLVADGAIKVPLADTYPLGQLRTAMQRLKDGVQGKVAISVAD